MKTIKFDNAYDLVEYCIIMNIITGKVWVEHDPYGNGKRALLQFYIPRSDDIVISTNVYGNKIMELDNDKGFSEIDHGYEMEWVNYYKGTFELVLPFDQHTKPEVYQVGDTVEVLENVRECGDYKEWNEQAQSLVSTKHKIVVVYDWENGVSYEIKNGCILPHYCVRRVEPSKITKLSKQEIADKFGVDVTNIEIVE